MKKILAMVLLVVSVFGFSGVLAGPGTACGDLATPVDVACNDDKGTASTSDDEVCLIWVNGVDPGADGCYNESDAPA